MVKGLGVPSESYRPTGVGPRPLTRPATAPRGGGPGFSKILESKIQEDPGVRWSGHALDRLRASNIQLSEADHARLNEAVEKAAAKGSRESLVLLGDLALVVSVKNRTVITAVAPERVKENVFTNIDSAVFT